jgi:hypothetical protein
VVLGGKNEEWRAKNLNATKKKIMLILPCMPWINYGRNFENGTFWKIVRKHIKPYLKSIDIYAIDCIRLRSSGKMIGLWSPYKDKEILDEILLEKLDSYPAWEKYKNNPRAREELTLQVTDRLIQLRKVYESIVAYLNVRVYYECIKDLAPEFRIILLPKIIPWRTPRVTYSSRYVNELVHVLSELLA